MRNADRVSIQQLYKDDDVRPSIAMARSRDPIRVSCARRSCGRRLPSRPLNLGIAAPHIPPGRERKAFVGNHCLQARSRLILDTCPHWLLTAHSLLSPYYVHSSAVPVLRSPGAAGLHTLAQPSGPQSLGSRVTLGHGKGRPPVMYFLRQGEMQRLLRSNSSIR